MISNERSPGAVTPQGQAAPTTTAGSPARILSQGGRRRRAARRRESLIAHASVYAPCPQRTLWGFAYVCPWCGLGHFGRAQTEDQVTGLRRSRCGRLVVVRAARVYRGRADSGAAA